MSEFVTYKKYQNKEQAKELIQLLTDNSIEFEVDDTTSLADFITGKGTEYFFIKIKTTDFITVNDLLKKHTLQEIQHIGTDYYMFDFENDELIEVLTEPDSWGELNVNLAKKILADRGVVITKELEDTLY